MKKFLLCAAAAIALSSMTESSAVNRCYSYVDSEGLPVYGMMRRVSPNGLWATGGDDYYETGAFLVNTTDPENLIFTTDGILLDVNDEGLCVGSWYEPAGGGAFYKRAAIFKDGEWKRLPEPEGTLGQSQAVAISADSKVIGGHAMCRNINPDEPGRYFPVVWVLNEATGEYVVKKLYNDLYLPGSIGFFVLAMTPDGRYLCGTQYLDFGDTIAVMLDTETGELKTWHEIEYRDWYFEAAGGEYKTMFVDGVIDGMEGVELFGGSFQYATNEYVFGSKATVSNVQPDGTGTVTNRAAVYDIANDEFVEGDPNVIYTCGSNPDEAFTSRGTLEASGAQISITELVGTGDRINYVFGMDNSATVLAAVREDLVSMGEYIDSPLLVMLDEACVTPPASVEKVEVVVPDAVSVRVDGRTIVVKGDSNAAVYTPFGSLVARSARIDVAPGVYIVVAGGKSFKIVVK